MSQENGKERSSDAEFLQQIGFGSGGEELLGKLDQPIILGEFVDDFGIYQTLTEIFSAVGSLQGPKRTSNGWMVFRSAVDEVLCFHGLGDEDFLGYRRSIAIKLTPLNGIIVWFDDLRGVTYTPESNLYSGQGIAQEVRVSYDRIISGRAGVASPNFDKGFHVGKSFGEEYTTQHFGNFRQTLQELQEDLQDNSGV